MWRKSEEMWRKSKKIGKKVLEMYENFREL
jgi:hypothetical protein